MGLWDRLFGKAKIIEQPNLKFGRYSDAYKTPEQYQAWDKALQYFDEGKIIESYHYFFFYLKDPNENNLEIIEHDDENFEFVLYHGSKKIMGEISNEKLKIHTKVAKIKKMHIGFLRRLLEQNYQLNYSRFAIDNEFITLEFDTYLIDGSPYKLYYAIKELANKADKLDDILLDEFNTLAPHTSGIVSEISPEIVAKKIDFLRKNISFVLNEAQKPLFSSDDFTGGYSYLILDVIYKLDYLIKPEGSTMEAIERIHRKFFAKDGLSIHKKNQSLIELLKKILQRTDAEFQEEIYNTVCTFGITKPITQEKITKFIKGEIPQMDWYIHKGHEQFALGISGYVVGYCFFYYAVPIPTRKLFALYYRIIEQDYFTSLGFDLNYIDKNGLNKKSILSKIAIVKGECTAIPEFQNIILHTGYLNFQSKDRFAKSYLEMVANMKY